jgi:MFS transporter, DHA1 family, chloramphenicol/florfenicol resistance protein
VLGALIAGTMGWRFIFILLGTCATAALLHAWCRWPETLPTSQPAAGAGAAPILQSATFWVYTLGFSTAMGSFFVFFSVAPRVLIDGAGYSPLAFSGAFATVALVMMATTAIMRRRVAAWGTARWFRRGIGLMLTGAGIMALCAMVRSPGFLSFIVPMWIIAAGIVLVVSVAANGALEGFDQTAGTAVALYYAVQGVVVAVVATAAIGILDSATLWPVVGFCWAMGVLNLISLKKMRAHETT